MSTGGAGTISRKEAPREGPEHDDPTNREPRHHPIPSHPQKVFGGSVPRPGVLDFVSFLACGGVVSLVHGPVPRTSLATSASHGFASRKAGAAETLSLSHPHPLTHTHPFRKVVITRPSIIPSQPLGHHVGGRVKVKPGGKTRPLIGWMSESRTTSLLWHGMRWPTPYYYIWGPEKQMGGKEAGLAGLAGKRCDW